MKTMDVVLICGAMMLLELAYIKANATQILAGAAASTAQGALAATGSTLAIDLGSALASVVGGL